MTLRLYHDEAGEGWPVLLLHNGLCDSRMWDRQVDSFAPCYRVVRCDLPGFGRTPAPTGPYSMAADVLELLDELAIERTALVGNSLGGGIARDLCSIAPERIWAAVLVSTGLRSWAWSDAARAANRRFEEALAAGDLERAVKFNLRLWLDGLQRGPEAVDPGVRGRVTEMLRPVLRSRMTAPSTAKSLITADGPVDRYQAPALVVVGDQDLPDINLIADQLVNELPDARKVVIAGAGHVPSLERPIEFDQLVLDFLASASPGTA